ncbi:MAG: homoserine kinase [Balneola sp.]|nr:homoserine kinase [Balneola sp.]|tara:strand:+ start:12665 stop:13597 length:933 start_codon:yes stop_codon:yes gene_type:complete
MKKCTVFAPATVANVGSGFDVLGFALCDVGDTVHVKKSSTPGLVIESIIGANNIPSDPVKNVCTVAAQALLDCLEEKQENGYSFIITKEVAAGSGLGSSASSSAAAVVALNELLGSPFSRHDLIPFAMKGEALASGAEHADNVAPSILGGFTLIQSYEPLRVVNLHYPEELVVTVVHPHVEVKTVDSKRILKQNISLKTAITQWANVGGLVAGLAQENFELIGHSLHDVVAEPTRSMLIPMYEQVKIISREMGGLGCSISGSGPSIFVLTDSMEKAKNIADSLESLYMNNFISCDVYLSKINKMGCQVIQ